MIGKYLVKSYNGEDEGRKEMHITQNLAGMAFSNVILGIVHSIAHKTEKILNIVVGAGNMAMDVARTAKRQGNNVIVAYRKPLSQALATRHKITETINDGVNSLQRSLLLNLKTMEFYLKI